MTGAHVLAPVSELIGIPFLRGGRDPRVGVDCLGLVLLRCQQVGLPWCDPWLQIEAAWRRGERAPGTLMPPEWRQLAADEPDRDNDIWFLGPPGNIEHVAIVAAGHLLTTEENPEHPAAPSSRLRRLEERRRLLRERWRCDA